MQDSLMQQNPMPESPTQVPRTLRIPINSAYTFGTKNKLPAVLFVVPSLVVLDRWRPPFGIAIVLGVVLLTVLSLVLRWYWLLEVVEAATPPRGATLSWILAFLSLPVLSLLCYFLFGLYSGIKLNDFGLFPFHLMLTFGFGFLCLSDELA